MTETRRENLIRAMAPSSLSDDGKTLFGHFARFNQWNLIDSAIEGRFVERLLPGSFTKTFEGRTPKALFQHGKDPQVGEKPIAFPARFGTDAIGPTLEGDLLDGLDPLVVSGLRAGAYGMSYRFSIPNRDAESWVRNAKPSDYNPEGLPERSIREVQVFEAGPVTWPADAGTDVAVRSMTDEYTLDNLTADPERLRALIEAKRAAMTLAPCCDCCSVGCSCCDVDCAGDSCCDTINAVPGQPQSNALTPVGAERAHSEAEPRVPIEDTPTRSIPVAETYRTAEDKTARVAELEAAIKRQAEETTGTRSIEEQARWDADKAELITLRADLAVIAEARAFVSQHVSKEEGSFSVPNVIRTKSVDDIYNPDQLTGIGFRNIEDRNQGIRDNAMRSLESANLDKAANKDALAFLLDRDINETNEKGLPETASRMIVTGSPAYKRAFAKYLKTGTTMAFTAEEQRAAALAVVGTTTTGGYAVPYVFDPTIIRIGAYTAQNPYRAACRTVTIANGNHWLGVTVGAVTSAYAAEAAAATEQGPTFAQPTYTVQRVQAFATVSIETLEDRPDISGELTAVFAESKATLEENQFTLGVGSTVYPQGMFLSGAYTVQTTATNDTTAILDTQVVEGALPLRFRANGAWFMNRSTLRQLLTLDTSYRYFSGQGIQYPGDPNPMQIASAFGGGNSGYKLLGYPVWEVPSAVSTLTTDASVLAAFCDPSTYVIVDRIGMNVEVIPNMLNGATPSFPTGQRGIFAYWRNTARVLVADGGRQLVVQ